MIFRDIIGFGTVITKVFGDGRKESIDAETVHGYYQVYGGILITRHTYYVERFLLIGPVL
jgi:hypothetical protein